MKRFLLLLFLVSVVSSRAQMLYKLNYSTSLYTEISGGSDVSPEAWDSSHDVQLPFAFGYFDKDYNNIFITYSGVYFSDLGDNLFYSSDNLIPEDMNYLKSPISFDITGNSPDRIVKVQYKNIKDQNIDTSVYEFTLNLQIWFYETSNKIEFHFGNCTITDPNYDQNFIGLININNSPYYAIDSTASNPVIVRVLNAGAFKGIKTYPVNGQVYTLSPSNWSNLQKIDKPYKFRSTENGFSFSSESDAVIGLYDMQGRLVQTVNYSTGTPMHQEINGLSGGIYLMNIQTGNQNFSEKIRLR